VFRVRFWLVVEFSPLQSHHRVHRQNSGADVLGCCPCFLGLVLGHREGPWYSIEDIGGRVGCDSWSFVVPGRGRYPWLVGS
jgi:hypothetical protein